MITRIKNKTNKACRLGLALSIALIAGQASAASIEFSAGAWVGNGAGSPVPAPYRYSFDAVPAHPGPD